jgi:hypothetical protein
MQHSTFVSSRDHRVFFLLLCLGGVGVAGLAVDPAEAALMNYTLDGGNSTISGSVGGTNFTNESWTMTATADSSLVQNGTFSGLGGAIPTYFLPTTVALWIGGTSSPVATVTMSNYTSGSNSFVWGVFSSDTSATYGQGRHASGFSPADLSTTPYWTASTGAGVNNYFGGTPGIYNDLSASGIWTGVSFIWSTDKNYMTSGGTLVLTGVSSGANGTWTIANASAVPGGGVAVLLAAGAVRRRRR